MNENKISYDRTSYILVVEDDETLLKFFKIHLNKFFSKVIVVKNAKDALETMKTTSIDLVVSDFKMPRMNGIQLLRKIKKADPTIPFIFVSGFMMDDEQEEICHLEADGFLKKPFEVDTFNFMVNAGKLRREKMVQLDQIINDRKKLSELISGKVKLANLRAFKNNDLAHSLLNEIMIKIKMAS